MEVEAAMRAATYIMSDDLEGAEAGLANGNSTFHKVRMQSTRMPGTRLTGFWRENIG